METHTLLEPCTTEYEHHRHPFMILPFYNLGHPMTLVCPGYDKRA